ncbi:hypothetical protein QUB52_07455 [Microcoleus sp. A6-C6]|uniref:hypothetical protein n=1 Tax=Microcoleus sp. A2-C2 TaxID=2818530 RepID=UPI002FD6D6E9
MTINPLTAFREVLPADASRRAIDRMRRFQGSVLVGLISIASRSNCTGLII